MESKTAVFDESIKLIDNYLEFAHTLPSDILSKASSLHQQIDQAIETGVLSPEQKSLSFYIKAGLQLLKQQKFGTTESLLLKSVF